ncbi:MAG: GAF domain-containing protein [Spirochaetales bacterium]|nr:GAF domain-containing protein [Spirochaetales bacterium]MCF7937520.1 GAF domain-containing protein [Spirochaetales bacterium]
MEQLILISNSVVDYLSFPKGYQDAFETVDDPVEAVLGLKSSDRLGVILVVEPHEADRLYTFRGSIEKSHVRSLLVVVSRDGDMPKHTELVYGFRTGRISESEFDFLIEYGFEELEKRFSLAEQQNSWSAGITDNVQDQEALINIGKSLSSEKDPDTLLRSILYMSKQITGADAGSIFLVEDDQPESKQVTSRHLRFAYSNTFSLDLSYESFTMPLNTGSIAGYVAVTGNPLNIPDVYKLTEEDPVSFNQSFDIKTGYRTKSMLVVPMRNHLDDIIGVIQLINSKERLGKHEDSGNEAYQVQLETSEDFDTLVVPFDSRYESLMEAIAGQAAVAIENSRLIKQIEQQFEEFVKASVTAIESRDPATSGHSFRVAGMCLALAHEVNNAREGQFRDVFFSDQQLKELEYAALLHDYGKVYIDPSIFLKARKLFDCDYNILMWRLKYLYRSLEVEYSRRIIELQRGEGTSGARASTSSLVGERDKRLEELSSIMNELSRLNEPTVSDADPLEEISKIRSGEKRYTACDLDGSPVPILTDREAVNLSIRRGSLNEEERKVIQSHVEHTYSFVSKIPWPEQYRHIPEIARKHHEFLDGSGYPLGLSGKDQIPPAARIMTIADLFDALAASDRPYKKALPFERILEILHEEAGAGKIDEDLVDLGTEAGIFDKAFHGTLETDPAD